MKISKTITCAKCKKIILPGRGRYRVKIEILSDFDGIIPFDPSIDPKKEIEKIEQELKTLPPELIEEEVHQEFTFIICPSCKEKFSANPLNRPLDDTKIPNHISKPKDSKEK